MEEKDYGHRPVLLDECLEALAIKPGGVYDDLDRLSAILHAPENIG